MLPATMTGDLERLQAVWDELKTHVEELAGEHRQYVEFFEAATEAYVVTDAAGAIVEANGAAVDILGRRKRYLRRKPFVALLALGERQEFRRRLGELAGGAAGCSWRTVLAPRDERIAVLLSARRIERAGVPGGICWRMDPVQIGVLQ